MRHNTLHSHFWKNLLRLTFKKAYKFGDCRRFIFILRKCNFIPYLSNFQYDWKDVIFLSCSTESLQNLTLCSLCHMKFWIFWHLCRWMNIIRVAAFDVEREMMWRARHRNHLLVLASNGGHHIAMRRRLCVWPQFLASIVTVVMYESEKIF